MAPGKKSLPLRVLPCSRQDGKARVSVDLLLDPLAALTTFFQYPE